MLAHKLRRARPTSGLTLSFNTSAVSNANTITIPAGALVGDLAVLFDQCFGGTTDVIPTGWTGIATATAGGAGSRGRISYKVLVGGDPGASITGLDATSEDKVMLVFTPSATIATVTVSTWNIASTALDPASQSVLASGQATPLVVLGSSSVNGGTAAFATASPAFDATVATADADLLVGYKIYNSSPADHTIDQNDLGNDQIPASGYLIVS